MENHNEEDEGSRKWKVLFLYHKTHYKEELFIFIQYFRFLFDISSVICWTEAKQERRNGEDNNRGGEELKNNQIWHHTPQLQPMLIIISLGKISWKNTLR